MLSFLAYVRVESTVTHGLHWLLGRISAHTYRGFRVVIGVHRGELALPRYTQLFVALSSKNLFLDDIFDRYQVPTVAIQGL